MLRFGADENINYRIVQGVRLRLPDIDILRVQEAGLSGAADPVVLEWAASQGRILLSHDLATIGHFALARLSQNHAMPGLLLIPNQVSIGQAVDDITLIAQCSTPEEWNWQIRYLPLR